MDRLRHNTFTKGKQIGNNDVDYGTMQSSICKPFNLGLCNVALVIGNDSCFNGSYDPFDANTLSVF